jgi:hypothetical protein
MPIGSPSPSFDGRGLENPSSTFNAGSELSRLREIEANVDQRFPLCPERVGVNLPERSPRLELTTARMQATKGIVRVPKSI